MPHQPRPLPDLHRQVLAFMKAHDYGQTAAAIWRDGMFVGPQSAVRDAVGSLARRQLVKSHGCSRVTVWELTDKGRALDLETAP